MVVYSILLFAVGAVFLALGIPICRGNTGLIHDYHQKNIPESDRKAYGKAFAKVMFGIALTMISSGILALFGENKVFFTASIAVLFAGILVSLFLLGKVQKRYNGGLF